ncbi:methionine aminotransferase [Kordia sp. YSTF-M3]|uniref:Methionine aminotransferase n=1 Tax=Kordia aestuariivivens TaxID=2759037 RepID=A0ABR7Q7A7_9FLAO|nr:methionine aminotransferase [Kordia aestuariivivens]MBC8754451.1 methionine aminotransferase [Kordia aestuariivivens]
MQQTSKLPNVGTTIFTVMSQLAAKENALNLAQGFPNFPSDPKLIEMVQQALRENYNQYAPMPGALILREAIAEKMELLYQRTYNPETEITVTAGATQAIFTIISAFVRPNDEVIIFTPAYDCYAPAVEVHGGKVVPIQLKGTSFSVDWNEVRSKITTKTKLMIINTPHNPSGTVLSRADMLELSSILENTNIILLSDEVYEHIIFDDAQHQSVALYPKLAERAFITASFGKTFHNTGWKMGYCVAPKALMDEFKKVHQFNVFSVNHPMQIGIGRYLKNPENYLELPAFFQRKRDYFLNAIKDSRFTWKPSQGTYFQVLSYKNITDELDTEFAKRLTREHKIASIPLSVFNTYKEDHKLLRFCFAKTEETLAQAAEILNKI